MKVYITGDTHGIDGVLTRMSTMPAKGDDVVIVLEDFGIPWSPLNSDAGALDANALAALDNLPWTTAFVDGNHENHAILDSLDTASWQGGTVGIVSEKVYHLKRGEIYDLNGLSIFCMGGGESIDKQWRVEGRTWWPQEIPSKEEREKALRALEAVGRECDVILTHCPPCEELIRCCLKQSLAPIPDEYAAWLQNEIADKVSFKTWAYGHMHVDDYMGPTYKALFRDTLELLPDGTMVAATPAYPDIPIAMLPKRIRRKLFQMVRRALHEKSERNVSRQDVENRLSGMVSDLSDILDDPCKLIERL